MDDEPIPKRHVQLRHEDNVERQRSAAPPRLMEIISFLAGETDRVIFGDHAQERMEERGVSSEDVYRVLRLGSISGAVTPGKGPGEWKCKVVAKPRGSRKMGVATIVVMSDYLFIKTVEWEDR